jgi:hypothetical protein
MKKIIVSSLIAWIGIVIASVPVAADNGLDNTLYAELLSKYVKNGVVDYQGFKAEEKRLDAYLKILESADTKKLSRNERFAFYINAYNAWTIKLILSGYPGVESIKDLGSLFSSPWEKKICRIDGKILTLNDIEHKILRPKFKDPRVHFAIVCASKGCPKLISKPYQGNILNKQLDDAAGSFVNNRERNYFDGDTLYVSSIFKWFSEDFNNDVIPFFDKYAAGDLKKQIAARSGNIQIKYLDYDWSLNGR